MTLFAVALVVFSALLHAGWNILGKSNQVSGAAFFLATSSAAATLLTPYLIWYLNTIGLESLPPVFWKLLLVSGISQMVYLLGLGLAYKHADIGVVYPMARALPVLMVGVGTVVLGHQLEPLHWFGFALITLGCLVVPLDSFKQLNFSSYLNLGVLWALVAAVGTTGYSIIDKEALLLINQSVGELIADQYSSVFYLGIQFWAIAMPISVYLLATKQREQFGVAWNIRRSALIAGSMMAATYGLVLFAMTMTENVSFVVALRQISIVFGLIMGVIFLKEKWYLTRGVGVLLILVGLVLSLS
ncbi:multidrug transporter [Vibrio paucivorans]